MKNIFLCGFMGCGKTTVGTAFAALTGCEFIDLDAYLVQQNGKTVPELFAAIGESGFRALETKAIETLAKQTDVVVATGGGALVSPHNAKIARGGGKVIYLDVPFEVCYRRIQGDANRPIAQNSSEQELRALFAARDPLYRQHSDWIVNALGRPEECAKAIQRLGCQEIGGQ